ncbi:hypothetical protein CLOLEP_01171 [[Clostridium] leptum DSM 753]|uniref:Uncharacterized protein n=1 Tax=[Clostridium] leptum DSM 753 TaxID=428125 RepID=A7VRI7_9FIRM|nr:hypothetical protein CLOLEP_01171 [[Clostridium] leptum DSM 753]
MRNFLFRRPMIHSPKAESGRAVLIPYRNGFGGVL